jgi:hypothetical protein
VPPIAVIRASTSSYVALGTVFGARTLDHMWGRLFSQRPGCLKARDVPENFVARSRVRARFRKMLGAGVAHAWATAFAITPTRISRAWDCFVSIRGWPCVRAGRPFAMLSTGIPLARGVCFQRMPRPASHARTGFGLCSILVAPRVRVGRLLFANARPEPHACVVRPSFPRWGRSSPELQPRRVTHDVASGGSHRIRPARSRLLLGDGVKAPSVDHHPCVFCVRVDRDVAARTGVAIGLKCA